MLVIRTQTELDNAAALRSDGEGLGGVCVPTMGALHEGHARLISEGEKIARERKLVEGCIVTIFVNPTQFNEPADFQRYPRTLDDDLAICDRAGASAVFAPDPSLVYPPAEPVPIPPLPRIATEPGLEDAHRPGHFAGVCQVVQRLFSLLRPRVAVFGEKDWQQLQVIRAMTQEQRLGVEILSSPTVRDPDGLAMSSRNRFLSAQERGMALAIPRALAVAGRLADAGDAEGAMRDELERSGLRTEYAVVRDAATLLGVRRGHPARVLIAARCGRTRLIDNAAWAGADNPA